MRLSKRKMNHIAGLILQAMEKDDSIDFLAEVNIIKRKMVLIIEAELKKEAEIEQKVRLKIESQKRNIPEGSEEYHQLFRKYYSEEIEAYRSGKR
jgi:hypothetical protein